jgi:hypothetical protein
MTDWATPDQDTMDRIVFHLQCSDWTHHQPGQQ